MSEEKEEDTKKIILAMITMVYEMTTIEINIHSRFLAELTHGCKN